MKYLYALKWMKLKNMTLSKLSQIKKDNISNHYFEYQRSRIEFVKRGILGVIANDCGDIIKM